jgi:hypothetical protein
MSGRRTRVAALIAAALLAGYVVLWFIGAQRMRAAIDAWADEQRAAGLFVGYERARSGGFPFALGALLDRPAIAGDSWSWRAPELRLSADALRPDRLVLSASGDQVLNYGATSLRIDAPNGTLVLDETDGVLRLLLAAPHAIVSAHEQAPSTTLAPNPAHPGASRDPSADQAQDGSRLSPGRADESAGVRLTSLDIAATISNGVELQRLAFETEGARVVLSGAVALDVAGHAQGMLFAEIVNPGPLAHLLARIGLLDTEEAEQAAAALTLAAIAGGGKVSGLITLSNGVATFAGVKLAELPVIGRRGDL